jgi:peptidyl-prolyl cis-trans isomerase B (cyclophilin B)
MKPIRLTLLLLAFLVAAVCLAAAPQASKSAQKASPKTARKAAPAAPKAAAKPSGPSRVAFDTTKGRIIIELYPDKAPKSVDNFLKYVKAGHYDGTIFHRVIPGFMVQGGGFTPDMKQKPTRPSIPNEADNGLANDRGTVAMARTSDPNSAGAQFFINVVDNGFLNFKSKTPQGWGYTVFGKVVEGMEVADAIAAVKTKDDVPVQPIVVKKARVVTK